jgi:hypothetical protein
VRRFIDDETIDRLFDIFGNYATIGGTTRKQWRASGPCLVWRLIYQPDEVPTEPMAMPEGESTDMAWAGCLPEDGSVVVVLSNHVVEDIGGMAEPLVDAVRSA